MTTPSQKRVLPRIGLSVCNPDGSKHFLKRRSVLVAWQRPRCWYPTGEERVNILRIYLAAKPFPPTLPSQ
ncbi:MAG: hypothetical protein AAF989_16070 [Planctomycetota bacterium]